MLEIKKTLIETRDFLQRMLINTDRGISVIDLKQRIKNLNHAINSIERVEKMIKRIRTR